MKCYVGLDIGAVSIKAAVLVDSGDQASLESSSFTRAGEVDGYALYLSAYRRTRGHPIGSATELLEQITAAVGAENIRGVCLAGGAGHMVSGKLDAANINEFKAIAQGLSALGITARTVFEMGGQSSKYLLLGPTDDGYGIIDYSTNGDCAAGTGSFIDQQANRLKFSTEEVGRIALEAQRTAQVAGRCSVFAKSDMIHAQQKGYAPSEVLAGLCNAVARNFKMAVVRSHAVEGPVVFIGGLAANAAVVRGMRAAFDLDEQQLTVPPHYTHILAVGAAVTARKTAQSPKATAQQANYRLSEHRSVLLDASDASRGAFPTAQKLTMDAVTLLRDQLEPAVLPEGRKLDAYLGIDIGSVSTNLVLIDSDGNMIKEIYVRTKGRPIEVVTQGLRDIADELGQRIVIRGVGTTGSGRELIGELVGADTVNDEITAHKTGSTFVGRKMLDGQVPDTIFEIGGQDSKYISLQDGVVVDFTMNEACAAGTGSFLEERADELDISIVDEFARLALSSDAPIRLGERCTVFMERDIADYVQRGAAKADLVAGLAYSVVYNYINRVVRGRPIGKCIFFQGGTAYNDAVAAAFSIVLGKRVIVPPYNGVIGAIGAALLAQEKMALAERKQPPKELLGQYISERTESGIGNPESGMGNEYAGCHASTSFGEACEDESVEVPASTPSGEAGRSQGASHLPISRFRGYDMSAVQYKLREFTCNGCSNHCIMQEFDVEGEKTYWGDKCSEKYRKRRKTAAKPAIGDLFAYRQTLLMDEAGLPAPAADARTVGIPLAMFAIDSLPFWRTFWSNCGFKVVTSDPTNRQIAASGASHAVAEPCFPVIVAHGHLAQLIEKGVDYLFVPNTVSAETQWKHTESHLCPWNQTIPFVLRRSPEFEKHIDRFLVPCVQFRKGQASVSAEMEKLLAKMGVAKAIVRHAISAAYQAQGSFRTSMLQAGKRALDTLLASGEPGIVILGRPYNLHDAGVNLSVARKLRDYYGVNCLPIDALDVSDIDIRDINVNMFWEYGRRMIAAAKIVAQHDNLHMIHITNFKCGPDSFIKHFLRRSSGGKPLLSLQFDGHSNDAGMMTRCEAYLDSKGILRPSRAIRESAGLATAGLSDRVQS